MTDAQVKAQLNSTITANGVGAITGAIANLVLNALYKWTKHKPRVVRQSETYIIPPEGEISYALNFYNKGVVEVQGLPDDNYGTGIPVSRRGIFKVSGVIVNEGIIVNNGIIIN